MTSNDFNLDNIKDKIISANDIVLDESSQRLYEPTSFKQEFVDLICADFEA
jgi:hypothetical protein